jgi:SAM-dependent methyltransferase
MPGAVRSSVAPHPVGMSTLAPASGHPGGSDAPPDESREIRPISHASTNRRVLDLVLPLVGAGTRVLDVGAGEGYFSQLLGEHVATRFGVAPADVVHACDVHPEYFRYAKVPCAPIDPSGRLPYDDATFDVVCSLEVIEHVEDQFHFCRELLRVLRPGGTAIVSTPNVLNVNSRWRTLHSGFAVLFDPLPQSEVDVVHTSGHIHPIGWYYLALMLRRAGARTLRLEFDRHKRSAHLLRALLWPVLVLGQLGFRRQLARKKPGVLRENAEILRELNGTGMLTARSVIAVVTT